MNQILVQIYLPANGIYYDVYVPDHVCIVEVTELLADLFTEISNGFFVRDDINYLCQRDKGEGFPPEKTLRELNVKNGSKLIFI